MVTDPYATLGVSPTATAQEITRAYRRRLRSYHPDLRGDPAGSGADDRLHAALAAYALLRDPRRRAEYDRSVRAAGPVPVTVAPGTPVTPVVLVVPVTPVALVVPVTPVAPVTPVEVLEPPPLWAGPVRRHRSG